MLVTMDAKKQLLSTGTLSAATYSSLVARLPAAKPESPIQVSAN
jgi:hypothetical protein